MRELLDSSTKRRLAILEQLNNSGDWISSNELAETNHASLRTINSDVHYLKENWHPHLIIETSKKNGVRLTTPPSSHARIVYTHVLEESEPFQLLEKIFFDPTKNIEDWENELFISESSLYRITNQLSKSLEKFNIYLKKRPCMITSTNEVYARFFYTTFFNELYSMHAWPFSIDKKKTVQLAQYIFDKTAVHPSLDEIQIIYLAYIIAVTFTRQSQGCFIDSSERLPVPESQINMLENVLDQMVDLVEPLNLELTTHCIKDLIYCIFFFPDSFIAEDEINKISEDLEDFTEDLANLLDITLSDKVKNSIINVLSSLYCQKTLYPHDDYILFNQYNFNGPTIFENYPTFSNLVSGALYRLQLKTNFPWYDNFLNETLYWLMIKWDNLPKFLEEKKEKAKILILSDLGKEHAELLQQIIGQNFTNKVKIEIYQDSIIFLDNLSTELKENYDYFVTTFFSQYIPEEKLIIVDAFPSNRDWGELRKAINKVHQLNSLERRN